MNKIMKLYNFYPKLPNSTFDLRHNSTLVQIIFENLPKLFFILLLHIRGWPIYMSVHQYYRPILEILNIGRNTNFHRYFTDILVCLSVAQLQQIHLDLIKTSKFYWNLFNKIIHVLLILIANNFRVLLCNSLHLRCTILLVLLRLNNMLF